MNSTAEIVSLPTATPKPAPIDRQTFIARITSFAGRGREVEAIRFAAELWEAVGG